VEEISICPVQARNKQTNKDMVELNCTKRAREHTTVARKAQGRLREGTANVTRGFMLA
jgi:hypothetical protein